MCQNLMLNFACAVVDLKCEYRAKRCVITIACLFQSSLARFIQANLFKIQGLLKTFLLFSRTENL